MVNAWESMVEDILSTNQDSRILYHNDNARELGMPLKEAGLVDNEKGDIWEETEVIKVGRRKFTRWLKLNAPRE